ncbi:DUF5400 family protein [Methanosphaerula subterraneus]|uniref:DUF5400 family protein n=1 Tax=Methanosphaerula subterraneus TaxID=3350244 RepID=UPI003F832E04
MQTIYLLLVLAIVFSNIVPGFISFRVQGMNLAVHFITLACGLLIILATLLLQVLACHGYGLCPMVPRTV